MTLENAAKPSQAPSANFQEDLLALSEYEFCIAETHCRGCADYHALFGYGRLAGLHDGINLDEDILAPLLARIAPNSKLLIACAADAGLLALTARATAKQKAAITVADRCATPLAVCDRFAQTQNLPIQTIQNDFSQTVLSGTYDLVLAHNVLLFVPETLQVKFLRNIAQSLGSSGTLVLVSRGAAARPGGARSSSFRTHNKMFVKLVERAIPLPESEQRLRDRLKRLDDGRRQAVAGLQLTRESLEGKLDAAGLAIIERFGHDRRRHDGGDEVVPTFFFVASRRQK
jgi:SAM-dependent methyltransferase